MASLKDLLKKFFCKKENADPIDDVETLRSAFQERYHNFKLLLSSNSKVLGIMAGMEQALEGIHPFGMAFVRSSCTSISVNVFRMVKKLDLLAPEKYQDLFDAFNKIQQKLDPILQQKKELADKRLAIGLNSIDKEMADLAGSKMANLGEVKNKGKAQVPEGFVITAYAYHRFIEQNDLQTEIDRKFQATDLEDIESLYSLSAEIQQIIIRAKIPDDLKVSIFELWKELEEKAGKDITVALRSSALGEDEAGNSFAGQYRSVLNVDFDDIFNAYKEVIASKYSLPAITYRLNKGFRDEDISMCVGCMVMVDAKAGGVTYSRNPVDASDDSIHINSALGLPKFVVDGRGSCDHFVVSRNDRRVILEKIADKEKKFVCYPKKGVCRLDLAGKERGQPSLEPNHIAMLADIAIELEDYYGTSQDIEWAINKEDALYILQCRALQQREPESLSIGEDIVATQDKTILLQGGVTASPGTAYGATYKVDQGIDILQFSKGSILVARQALPRWAPLL
ncbi:MAG: PEP/pyruvate-binding domain-containing protein, partial [Pseudomonadota bacterium]